MAEVNTHAGNLRLVGGRLCLDFVNTIARRRHAEKLFLICTSLPAGSLSTGHSHGIIDRELFVKSLCRRIALTPLIPAPRLTGGTPA